MNYSQIHCDQTLVKNPIYDEPEQQKQKQQQNMAEIKMFCQHPVMEMKIGRIFSVHHILPPNQETEIKCEKISNFKEKNCDFTNLKQILNKKCRGKNG